jgi:Protein of unknown function (DUF2905)
MREETRHEGLTVPILAIHPYLLAERLAPTIPGQREDFGFAFPITTCLLLSLLPTGIRWLVRYFSRRRKSG